MGIRLRGWGFWRLGRWVGVRREVGGRWVLGDGGGDGGGLECRCVMC